MTTRKSQNVKIVHPIFFGLYPVLFLMSANLGEIPFQQSLRAVFVVPVVSVLLWLGLKLVLKDNHKAAFITTLLLLSFFAYGHLYNFLGQENVFNGILRRHRYTILLFVTIILLGSWWIIKKEYSQHATSNTFNLIGLFLVIFPAYQIASFEIRSFSETGSSREQIDGTPLQNTNNTPDIYYLIFDAYGRGDVLLDLYNYDNSDFLTQLQDIGFYVADCSTSNYEKTYFSLVSSLNMAYLNELGGSDLMKSNSQMDLIKARKLIVDNRVRNILETNFYTTVAFQSGFYWTRWDNADHFFSYAGEDEKDTFSNIFANLNEFESLLIETSAGRLLFESTIIIDIPDTLDDNNAQNIVNGETRQRIRYNTVKYTLDTLEEIPSSIRGPKFIFAHIVSPHQPFVFDMDGNFVSDPLIQENVKLGYPNQASFLNQRIITVVDKIITTSARPPIIIIQADHGPPETNFGPSRLAILNAYYLPEGGDKKLYSSITPVNTFRLIFDQYFGMNYDFLEDISQISDSKEDLFNFTVIPNNCAGD